MSGEPRQPGVERLPQASAAPGAGLPQIGVVLDTFSRPSEKFVVRELQQLLRDGAPLHIAAFHRGEAPAQAQAADVLEQVTFRPSFWSWTFWRIALPEILSPHFLNAFLALLREPDRADLRSLPTALWLASHFRSRGVTHVHAHFAGAPASAARLAAALLAAPYSVSVHGSDLTQPSAATERNVRGARFVLTCTSQNRSRVVTLRGGDPAHVHLCYHGLDLERFRPRPASRRAPASDGIRIVCVARLEPKKGIDTLIAACACLRFEELQLEIVGEGSEREALRRQAEAAGLANATRFFGAVSEDEVIRRLQEATLFALPCRRTAAGDEDGLPNVLVEALACGVPVVTTPVGAISELIQGGVTGLLVPPDDPDALAEAIRRLIADAPLRERLVRQGRKRVERDFDRRSDRVLEVFRKELVVRSGAEAI